MTLNGVMTADASYLCGSFVDLICIASFGLLAFSLQSYIHKYRFVTFFVPLYFYVVAEKNDG